MQWMVRSNPSALWTHNATPLSDSDNQRADFTGIILISSFSVLSHPSISCLEFTVLYSLKPSLSKHSLWTLLPLTFLRPVKLQLEIKLSNVFHLAFSIKMAQKSASPCTVSPYMDADWHLWMESMNHFLAVVQQHL